MLRLFIILVSVFAFSKVAVAAAEADMNKKPVTEVTKEATDKEATDKDAMTDAAAEDKAAEAKKTK